MQLRDGSALPAGFRPFADMPPPPRGCAWRWSGDAQMWSSWNSTGGARCSDLRDGWKYVLGVTYLPTGFELAYNHYVGRLGMRLPEVGALLARYPVDWVEFSWGGAALASADTARAVWRPGLTRDVLCAGLGRRMRRRRRRAA